MTTSSKSAAAARWPSSLNTITKTLSGLSFPCAIFWGDDLRLWHNQTWGEAAGKFAEQGRPYENELPTSIVKTLKSPHREGNETQTPSGPFLNNTKTTSNGDASASEDGYVVILSPLPKDVCGDTTAVMVQLLPNSSPSKSHAGKTYDDACNQAENLALDDLAIDEHPFFHRFAEMLPTGLAILDHNAEAVFINSKFRDLTVHVGEDQSFKAWPNSIHKDDYQRVIDAYQDAFQSQTGLRTEFRAIGEKTVWRLLLLTPLSQENLRHVSLRKHGGFICSIVDITSEKGAEMAQRKAAKEARERKEQQERFIDMISHEIRNPLSAILHCAEDIMEVAKDDDTTDSNRSELTEAADTIILCASHQRHIVDDVLSFSKLDSSMLSLNPKAVQPKTSIAKTLKMFQPEFRKRQLEFEYKLDVSYQDNHIEWVMADLRRIGQVVINLVSNAIKFTAKKEGEKKICVALGASSIRPTSYPPSVVFFDPDDSSHRLDATRTSEWGNGTEVYIMVAISDTGIGISDEGQKKLFQRFRQATPKTEEVYGGSGLGLNISRKLCQLHGGDIGVSSKKGVGSTFGFFFKVRISDKSERETSSEDDERDVEELARQMSALGNEASTSLREEDMPQKLKQPQVAHDTKASPKVSVDGNHNHTAEIAADILKNDEKIQNKLVTESKSTQDEVNHGVISNQQTEANKDVKRSKSLRSRPIADSARKHVLLVEDNLINQKVLSRKLTTKGFKVTTANNGREAIEAMSKLNPASESNSNNDAKSNGEPQESEPVDTTDNRQSVSDIPIDVILMDQEMPVMDGNEASRGIRQLEHQGTITSVPILGVTANVRDEQQQEMIDAGMNDVIHKPYRIEEIIGKINTLCSGSGVLDQT